MTTIFGVKSNTPINCKLKNGHTMYDWVVRKNCYPTFCMRTLCGDNKITAEEIEYLKAQGFVAGFIGNTDSAKNFNFDRQASHFAEFTKEENYLDAVFMATEPKVDTVPDKWAPYCPSAMETEDMSFWSVGNTSFGETTVENIYARDEKTLVNSW